MLILKFINFIEELRTVKKKQN